MPPAAILGSFADDLPQFLAGLVLLLAFALLLSRHRLADAALLQGMAAAAAVAWQSWTRGDPGLWTLAAIAIVTTGAALPLALRRLSRSRPAAVDTVPAAASTPVAPSTSAGPSTVAGVLLVVLAVLLIPPNAALPMRADVAVALAVLLLGLLTMVVRRGAVACLGGFLSMLNGTVLAMAATGTAIPATDLCVALLALAALGAAGLWLADLR